MSSSDDDAMEDGRFQLFLDDDDDDSGSEDDDVNDDDVDDDEDDDDDTSTDTEDPRFKSSLLRSLDFNEDDIIEEDDDDFVDDDYDDDDVGVDELRHHPLSYPAPIPWPPAIVSQQNQQQQNDQSGSGKKKKKPGIVYLSSIPTGYNVTRTITFFSQFGKVGRVFLQPDLKEKSKRRDKLSRNFTEGWVEFLSKRTAKEVAAKLNNAQVGGSKRSKAHDILWNIKYLPRFKWTHLSERLAYERASHSQKMRAEVSQAKREADFFRSNAEKSRKMLKRVKTDNPAAANDDSGRLYEFRQKETDAVLRSKRAKSEDQEGRPEQQQLARKGKKNKKGKKDIREAEEVSARNRKKTKKSSASAEQSEASPAKRARTRSSDRREFLKSVFGAKT